MKAKRNDQNTLRIKLYLLVGSLWRKFYPKLKEKLRPLELSSELERVPERIVEYPFVFKNVIKLKEGRILDVGCYGSYLLTALASLGYEVYGIDLRQYPVQYPNVKFIKGNICKTKFPNGFFDMIISVSTIEHIGIKEPYGDVEDPEGDKKAVKEMTRILKPDGKMLVTVPYGKSGTETPYRVYNELSLKELLSGLKIETIKYFTLKNGYWLPTSKVEAEKIETSKRANAVVLLKLSKHHKVLDKGQNLN